METGICESCDAHFEYALIHNGFNDSAFGYCDRCGCTLLLSRWKVPAGVKLRIHAPMDTSVEELLKPCPCGGKFRREASPRCPQCAREVSPTAAASYIEQNAPGVAEGWQWQNSWLGLYAIIIDNKVVENFWREAPAE